MAFNAIKYNVPLVFYHPNILNLNIDIESKKNELLNILEELEESREIIADGNVLMVKKAVLNSNNVVDTFFAIAMHSKKRLMSQSLTAFLKRLIGLDVNSKFLEWDITEIERNSKDLDREELLLNLHGTNQKPKGSRDQKRNFFAHSGFLKEITRVIREGIEFR